MRVFVWVAVCVSLLAQQARAGDGKRPEPEVRLAAAFQFPQIPGLSGPSADWRQWDSFLTFVVKRFAQDVPSGVQDLLGEAFLDSRYELASAIAPGKGGNPVPELFLNAWQRLSPIMNNALAGMSKQTGTQYASFIGAADKLASVGRQGAQLGLLQLSPDALRGIASLIEPRAAADPLAYSTTVDSALRSLLGFGSPLAAVEGRRGRFVRRFVPRVLEASVLPPRLRALVGEAASPVNNLNQWVPDDKGLEAYLLEVRSLLVESSDKVAAKNKLAEEFKSIYRQIVFTAAWQESCWRQFVKQGTNIATLASATGDLGLMQVNRHTWRGVYDLQELGGDIQYNTSAGGEILLHYLARYAVRRGEDKQPGGNLARATYSAYNGGPGQLGRYRAANVNPALRKVDEAFWQKFQAVSSGHEMDVKSCYQR
jgi:hypothetical protein